ncbi:MAG: type II toxin-antitoxin system MqsR family toxin [Deltaproteobacteria bacterium]|nr:type II toxin-antitoxin system MqsR family toxin [Deltaproteobacteria bacterium]
MPRWLSKVLNRIHTLAASGSVRLTDKALVELAALDLSLDPDDVCLVLSELTRDDFGERLRSQTSPEWLYVFKPEVAGIPVYLKLALRSDCVVISFHEDDKQ